uniref:REKLES domain-containing protein n=1 Tax=Syphacia muris TaxID=451379 RepID=A0A0N5AP54_9BILA
MSVNSASEITAAALSLLRPPLAAAFSQMPTFAFSDPSALLLLTQQLQNNNKISPLSPLNSISTATSNSLKKSTTDIQPPASPQSSSSSSAISSSPQPSPQRRHAAPVPQERKVTVL